jgi:small subunit ribosomal protein S17
MKGKNIGIDVKLPKQECDDENCPFHGSLTCRGRVFTGTVVSDKMHKTVVVEWLRRNYIKKYERYEKKRTKIKVHSPPCINAKEGDIVSLIECRPLSKTKNFVIVENLGKEKGFVERAEAMEEAKVKEKESKEETKEDIQNESS